MTFTMSDAIKQLESKYGVNNGSDLATRTANSNATQSRMGLGDTSNTPGRNDFSASQSQSTQANNNAVATSPYFQRSVVEDDRNFTEDTRRFDASLNAKSLALANEQSTLRYQSDNTLAGNRYTADANLTGNKYVADRGVDSTRLQADASKYSADANLQGTRYVADSNVKAASIGADASRFNALLNTGVGFFNSSSYRPTFNR